MQIVGFGEVSKLYQKNTTVKWPWRDRERPSFTVNDQVLPWTTRENRTLISSIFVLELCEPRLDCWLYLRWNDVFCVTSMLQLSESINIKHAEHVLVCERQPFWGRRPSLGDTGGSHGGFRHCRDLGKSKTKVWTGSWEENRGGRHGFYWRTSESKDSYSRATLAWLSFVERLDDLMHIYQFKYWWNHRFGQEWRANSITRWTRWWRFQSWIHI